MRAPAFLFIGLSFAAISSAALPTGADAAPAKGRPPAVHPLKTKPLDLTRHGPSIAMQAAQATQSATAAPGAAPPLIAVAAATTETVTTAPAGSVAPLTVRPAADQPGRVIASTDAAPLTTPNFKASDAERPPLAVVVGEGAALGRHTVDNTPPSGGLLRNNPELLGSQPTRGDVSVTKVF